MYQILPRIDGPNVPTGIIATWMTFRIFVIGEVGAYPHTEACPHTLLFGHHITFG